MKIIIFLVLTISIPAFSQAYEGLSTENGEEVLHQETNYETEAFLQSEEELGYPLHSENSDEYIVEEEVYDSESDDNDPLCQDRCRLQ